jgi:hypothetical protein
MENIKNLEHIRTIASCSMDNFHDYSDNFSIPVLLRNSFNLWGPAFSKWTEQFLLSSFKNVIAQAERYSLLGEVEEKSFSVDEYFNYMKTTLDENPFYLKGQFHLKSSMRDDFTVPEVFKCWYNSLPQQNRKYTLSWLYIGAARTMSQCHLDIWNTSAWNGVIIGKKIWLFFKPSDSVYLSDGKVNPFFPDVQKFPTYLMAKPLVCIQSPGDVVFTPSDWWHAVYNVEAGVSITENFINESNCLKVLSYFKSKGASSAYNSFSELIRKNSKKYAEENL